MSRFKREIGPMTRARAQTRSGFEVIPCLCADCRATNPIRQAMWERQQKGLVKDLTHPSESTEP